MYQALSNMGKNVAMIDRQSSFLMFVNTHSKNFIVNHVESSLSEVSERDIDEAQLCNELICIRDEIFSSPLSQAQCKELLFELCTG